MTKLIAKWGGIIGGVMVAVMLIEFALVPKPGPEHFEISEMLGYATILASLAIMFLAMNEQEKLAGDEPVTMWQRILLGSGAAVVAGACFGIYNVIYSEVLNPEFMDTYFAYSISQLPVQSGPDFERMAAELLEQKEMFKAPTTQFLVMASTVIMIGIPMSVLMAFGLKLRRT